MTRGIMINSACAGQNLHQCNRIESIHINLLPQHSTFVTKLVLDLRTLSLKIQCQVAERANGLQTQICVQEITYVLWNKYFNQVYILTVLSLTKQCY